MHTLAQLQQIYTDYADRHPFHQPPQNLYKPIDYILQLGGKKLRPALVLMGCNLFSDDVTPSLSAAYAIEIFHNFTLVHDDIMDAAPLRRGKPTVHHRYNLNTAILSGDAMLIYAYEYLRQAPTQLLPQLFEIFNRFAIGVCEGQQYDMDFETAEIVTIPEYLKMIELKTSVLLAGALEIGALIGGATPEQAHHLYEFGRNIGIAFQLQDDVLDTFGDPEKFGKKVGGDIVQNKKTFLVLKALELADEPTNRRLQQLMSQPTEEETLKIEEVVQIFNRLNVQQFANKEKEKFLNIAYDHLNALAAPPERKATLQAFAQFLIHRDV